MYINYIGDVQARQNDDCLSDGSVGCMNEEQLTQVMLDWATVFFRLTMHDFNAYVRTTGLSFIQMNALIHVFYRGPREVLDFAEFMQVTPAGASQMVERMVQQGWVRREEAPDDRRVRLVHLTEQGRELVEAGIVARERWIAELAATLTEEEREAVAAALRILTEKAARFERA